MKISCVLAGAVGVVATSEAFVVSPAGLRYRCASARPQGTAHVMSAETETGKEVRKSTWDRKSLPKKRPELFNLPSDSRNWEVENDRLEVWEGDPNPPMALDWVKAFGPSEEEIEAAELGFDWADPEGWFAAQEEKGKGGE